jgi:hypothetical protein
MIHRIVEPLIFPLLLVGLFWLSERSKNPDRKANREKMRFWVAVAILIACGELATDWHNEIGSSWQSHPELTFFATLGVFIAIFRITPPLRNSLTSASPDGPSPLQNQNKVS